MKVIMAREKEDYFLELAKKGTKLPTSYNVEALVTKEEVTPWEKMSKQMQALQTSVTRIENKDKTPKQYSLDTICPFPFDKNLYMSPFPS